MINNVGTVPMVFLVWVVGGALSLAGALTYAELAAAMPGAGGEYVYLTEAWGPVWGFLYSWTQMWVGKSGSIATLATAFFEYTASLRSGFRKSLVHHRPFSNQVRSDFRPCPDSCVGDGQLFRSPVRRRRPDCDDRGKSCTDRVRHFCREFSMPPDPSAPLRCPCRRWQRVRGRSGRGSLGL